MYQALLKSSLAAALACGAAIACAQSADDFTGLWSTAKKDAVVRMDRCKAHAQSLSATALCGTIVWDIELNNPNRTIPLDCNRKIVQLTRFNDGVWERGWAFDSRDEKSYEVKLRISEDRQKLIARLYVGNEMQGKNETFYRIAKVPPGCEGKRPERIVIK